MIKKRDAGTDEGRTRDLRFTRATPYHLATAPDEGQSNFNLCNLDGIIQ